MEHAIRGLVVAVALVGLSLAGCASSAGTSSAVEDDAMASSSADTSTGNPSSAQPSAPSPAGPPPAVSSFSASPQRSDAPDVPALAESSRTTCQTGLAYACGDIGPGGGTVFYAVSVGFPCGPKGGSATCTFLEAAANPWDPDSEHACPSTPCGGANQTTSDFSFSGKGISWCTDLGRNEFVSDTDDGIGYGYRNTAYMNTMCGAGSASQAAGNYQGGGLTDWYLPSKDELNALYAYPNRASIGGFNSGKYWTSSGGYPQGRAWFQQFSDGAQDQVQANGTTYGVRPIRAF